MKKLFLILIISLFAFNAHSTTNDSLGLVKLKQQVQAQDSTIKAMQVILNEVQIQKDFFSNEITIATTLFTLIVGLFSFVLGYLIPQNLKKEFKKKFSEMKQQFNTLKKDSEKRNLEYQKNYNKANCNFLGLIYQLNLNNKHYHEALFYQLMFLHEVIVLHKDKFSFENYNEKLQNLFLNVDNALNALKVSNKSKDDIHENLKLMNKHLDKIISIASGDLKNKLIHVKEKINSETWKILSNMA